jgi:formylglycine-generating enzyme required for sulfatase activity
VRALGWLAVAAWALCASDAGARKAAATPAGLAPAREHAPAGGVQVLRAPLRGRVRISTGTFEMGTSSRETLDVLRLCEAPTLSPMPAKQAVFASLCDEQHVHAELRLEGQPHQVTLSAFDLDRTEVRVGDYARCVEVGACAAPGFSPGDARFDRRDYPVTLVRWEDAARYCAWADARLPTEAEWEFAARGATRRVFPWGDAYNPHLANHGSSGPTVAAYVSDETDATDGYTLLAPVGSFPDGATPEGALDMAGNVSEWVADFWDQPDDNGYGYASDAAVDPQGPLHGVDHVVRGGSYASGPPWIRSASRGRIHLSRSADVGFRCAADAR